jgi:hypothetical protein
MKKSSTLFLKAVICLIAVGTLAAMIHFPQTEGRAANLDLISTYADPFILYLYVASIPFFVALYQAFKLLGYVDKNKIFSQNSVKAVANIKYCAIAFIGFIFAAISVVFVNSKTTTDDGAGPIMIGLITIFASSVMATAVAVLQKVLQNAVDLKSENDLTV